MKLIIISEALSTGGAETFVLRLAAAIRCRGVSVTIIVLRGDLVNQDIVNILASNVSIVAINVPFLRVALRIDRFFYSCGLNFSLVRWHHVKRLKAQLLHLSADIVHSNLLPADLVTARAIKLTGNTPWVTTMHGDYLAFEPKGRSIAARILNFNLAMTEIEKSVSHLVAITDQQLAQLNRLMPIATASQRVSKIYNGYAKPYIDDSSVSLPESLLAIPKDAFVIGMVSHGIRDKGWDVMIEAFNTLNCSDAWLVLVGDGDHLRELKSQVSNPQIIFAGNVPDPLGYIKHFDVGCLPSRIPTESLPTVIIEYLIQGKPVIATDVGEVVKMMRAENGGTAGIPIKLERAEEMTESMRSALECIYRDLPLRERFSAAAFSAAQKFDMDQCVDAHLRIYEKAIEQ